MYVCSDCGNESVIWKGQCDHCKAWNTLKEFKEAKIQKGSSTGNPQELRGLKKSTQESTNTRYITKSEEFNNVLWGGIVKGSIVLLSGEPWIWKSTLTLQLGKWIREDIVYISGEETENQIIERAERLWVSGKNIRILSESNLENILSTLVKNPTDIVIIDSISVMQSSDVSGACGSISQVRYITEKLVEYGKTTNTTFFIIGHITKDGSLAGPKTLEHMVDVVLFFEGDKFDNLRMLRWLKNRFGTTSEIALFKMDEKGLSDVENPWLEFISEKSDVVGSGLSITIEGKRPLIIETEALTTYTKFGYPKRSARGVKSSKLDLIIAVLWKYTSIKLESYDVYTNIARGLHLEDPGIDLAIAASIISSKTGKALKKTDIFIGELSLTGKVKNVMYLEERIKEAEKMWFTNIYIPKAQVKTSKKINAIPLKDISELVKCISS